MTTFNDQQQIINGLANRKMLAYFEDAGHRQSHADPVFGELRQRRHIVRQEHSLFTRRPGEQVWILRAREADVLDADQVQRWASAEQSTNDGAVEVLIGDKPEHHADCLRRASRRARMPFGLCRASTSFWSDARDSRRRSRYASTSVWCAR